MTFELNLEDHAKSVLCHGGKVELTMGFVLPATPFFLDLSTQIFLGGSASLVFSVHVVCVGGP